VGLILDASVLIAAERGTFDLDAFLVSAKDDLVAIAAVTASELLHGVERASSSSVRARRASYVDSVLADFPIIPFALAEARVHARIWAALAQKGKIIGPHDLIVAATAVSSDAGVITLNQREFKTVPGLVVPPIAKWAAKA
jgi:tRNA(fMet)-specific endonuclease VapC